MPQPRKDFWYVVLVLTAWASVVLSGGVIVLWAPHSGLAAIGFFLLVMGIFWLFTGGQEL